MSVLQKENSFDRGAFFGEKKGHIAGFNSVLDSKWYRTISHLLSQVQLSTVDFYRDYDFANIPLPVTCSSISSPFGLGSDSEPVEIDLLGSRIFLADSMQFHLEYLIRQGFDGVYYIMPTFRGEDTNERHLSQFFHSELELKGDLTDVMNLIDRYLLKCTQDIYSKYGDVIQELGGGLSHIQAFLKDGFKIPRITFEDGLRILGKRSQFCKFEDGKIVNISSEGERYLLNEFEGPVWITHYPKEAVPFYQAWTGDKKYALCADLLMGIGETVGCGQRHDTYEKSLEAIHHHQVRPESYEWYLQLKREYPMKTSGFGMGIERYILWLLNNDDIRDIPLFNRLKGREMAP